jgi:phosphatidylglycerol---prolipoprotein diacylglyceryl transferase
VLANAASDGGIVVVGRAPSERSSIVTLSPVPTAVIAFDFDPFLHLGDGVVRWETIGVAAAIFVALVVAAIGTRSLELRADDLIFVVLGIVPGAVVGGRLGYVLLHPDFFTANPAAILDPGIGSLQLSLGVIGGSLTGGAVAALLDGSAGRWFHVAMLPFLLAAGIGKLAAVLGGDGQGQPNDAATATAYLGPGPWASLGPGIPSHPSQAYEGLACFIVLAIVMVLLAVPAVRRPDGRAFLLALALWAIGRAIVASTWRDPVVAGPFRAEQLFDLAIVLGSFIGIGLLIVRERPQSPADPTG